jgi:hypothetical protein
MESFFAVIVWIATYDHKDEQAFQAKPLATVLLDNRKSAMDIVHAKELWFCMDTKFKANIMNHFKRAYRRDREFLRCLNKLRKILYPVGELEEDDLLSLDEISNEEESGNEEESNSKEESSSKEESKNEESKNEETGNTDPMKEGLFRKCMEEIDKYLEENKGITEINWINSHTAASHDSTLENLEQGGPSS